MGLFSDNFLFLNVLEMMAVLLNVLENIILHYYSIHPSSGHNNCRIFCSRKLFRISLL